MSTKEIKENSYCSKKNMVNLPLNGIENLATLGLDYLKKTRNINYFNNIF